VVLAVPGVAAVGVVLAVPNAAEAGEETGKSAKRALLLSDFRENGSALFFFGV